MIQIRKGKSKSLNVLAKEHYERISAKLKISDEQKKLINNDGFCNYLEGNWKPIIVSEPKELKKIIEIVKGFNVDFEFEICDKKTKGDIVLEIFFYSKYDLWKPYQLASDLGVDTCVYCNRQYISVIGTDNDKGTRCEFDHFYPKSKYPYLALSFYNLIPSCHICNSNLKGQNEFSLEKNIHPYIEDFENSARFTYIPTNYNGLVGESEFDIQFSFYTEDNDNKINNNISAFKLEEQYKKHKDYVSEIIKKRIIVNNDYTNSLLKLYPGAFQSKEEIYKFAFGNFPNESDFQNRPLSKLTRDIAEELGLI